MGAVCTESKGICPIAGQNFCPHHSRKSSIPVSPFFSRKALHQPDILLPFSVLCWWDPRVERSEMLAGTQTESEGEEHREEQFSTGIIYPTKPQHIWNRTSGISIARDSVCGSSSYLRSQGQETDSKKAKTMGSFQVQYGFHYFILHRNWHCSLPDIKR